MMIDHQSKLQAVIDHMIHQIENVIKRAGAEQDKRHPTLVAAEHWGSIHTLVWCMYYTCCISLQHEMLLLW